MKTQTLELAWDQALVHSIMVYSDSPKFNTEDFCSQLMDAFPKDTLLIAEPFDAPGSVRIQSNPDNTDVVRAKADEIFQSMVS